MLKSQTIDFCLSLFRARLITYLLQGSSDIFIYGSIPKKCLHLGHYPYHNALLWYSEVDRFGLGVRETKISLFRSLLISTTPKKRYDRFCRAALKKECPVPQCILYVFFHLTDDSCQYWLNLKTKKVTSPYYPKYFLADEIGCEWLITSQEGHIIALEFEEFEVSFKKYYHIFAKTLISKQVFFYIPSCLIMLLTL